MIAVENTKRSGLLAPGLAAALLMGCGGASGGDVPDDAGDRGVDGSGGDASGEASLPVVEIAIRRLRPDQDLAAFEAAREAFVTRLRAQDGVGADRELQAVFDFGSGGPPAPPVYIGMTQYDSLATFAAIGETLGSSPEAGAFFATFEPETFTALRPLRESARVDLASIASEPGQVLEVAVRDLSTYESFDPAAYGSARDAFLTLLTAQPGVVAEYQWVSAIDSNIVVGMTAYTSMEAFQAIGVDPAVIESAQAAAFIGAYPPARGYLNVVLR